MSSSKPEFVGAVVHRNFLGKQFLEILGLTIAMYPCGIEQPGQRYDFLEFLPSKILRNRIFGKPAL